nr:uncharacterized protein LOC109171795 isoform X1 [Ipomoea trifida]
MATVISALALSVVFLICNLSQTPAFADLVYEDGYSVTTVFDGNKLNIHPHSVLPQPGSSDLFLLDSTDSTVYALSIPESGEVSLQRLAGNGTAGYSDGDLSSAMFDKPKSFAVDARGNLYVADVKNHAVRKISKSGVTTIAGGFSNKAGKKDGSGKDATFSNDYELVFIPQRCALIVSDIGNSLVRQINLKAEDCSSDSQSALGSTTAWFLGVGISCLIGLIIGFVLRPYVIPHGGSRHRWYNRTWKRCQMSLGRPVLMLCFELRNAVVNSSSYSLLKQITYLTFSHLSLIFTSMFFPRIVEPQKPLEKPVSLLDLDNLDSSEPTKKYPRIVEVKDVPLLELDDTNTSKSSKPVAMANELKDLIHFDEGLLLSNKSESDFEDENETGSNGKIDGMIHANLCGFAELATATSSTEFPKSSLGLVAKRRVK